MRRRGFIRRVAESNGLNIYALIARMIRNAVLSSLTRHSHTRRTLHPSLRSLRATFASLRRFITIFDLQNFLLLFDGRSQRGHPCQKQPSTNRTTLDFGHAKSGLPAIGHCFLKSRILRLRSNCSIFSSAVPPDVLTAAMIFDRTFLDTLSIAIIEMRMLSNPQLVLNLRERVDSAALLRF